MSLMDKKISELSAEDIKALAKPIGIEGMPYPMVRYEKDDKGQVQQYVGVIDSIAKPMMIYTEMPLEQVQARLFREMPIPSMLLMLRNLLAKQAPTNKNRLFTVFGDAAFGKTYQFETFASIVHPQGAIQVDCGGMNMREIFFRTVIDYGEGVQEVLNQRLKEGKVSQVSVDYMKDKLGAAVVEKDGKIAIDWNKVGAADPEALKAVPTVEAKEDDSEEAVKAAAAENDKAMQAVREKYLKGAMDVLRYVYEKEGISVQNNSFGIKTVPGEFFEALWSGRPLFLDEFNKSKKGTLDSWQTVLQFIKGEKTSVTIYNPMSQSSGDDAMKAITVNEDDKKPGFVVGIAGNESKDGDTTQELSKSMMTRLDIMYVGNPTLMDWEHRISQIWTGLPLTTLHYMYQEFAVAKPVEFTQFLLDILKWNKSNAEIAAIPSSQIYFLQHWQETLEAVRQVAAQQDFRFQLSNPESKIFEKEEYADLADEISDATASQIQVSFRKIITDHQAAIEGTPEVRKVGGLVPNLKGAFNPAHLASVGEQEPGWHRFGANLENAMIEDIINVTKDTPHTRAALISQCEANGIMPNILQEARASDVKPLSELMKYDELKEMGGTDELKAVREVVMMALRSMNPGLEGSDDQIVPLANLGKVLKSLETTAAVNPASQSKAKLPKRQIIIPNDDLNQVKVEPVVAAEAISNYNELEGQVREEVDFRSVLAAMATPGFAEQNRAQLWLTDLVQWEKKTDQLPKEPKKPALAAGAEKMAAYEIDMEVYQREMEATAILSGQYKYGFNLGIAAAVQGEGEPAYLYILEDKVVGQMLIIGPETIPPQLETALQKNNVSYLVKSDPATKGAIDGFLTAGTEERIKKEAVATRDKNGAKKSAADEITENLISAFGQVNAYPEHLLKKDTSLGAFIVAADAPLIYTHFVKKAKRPVI